MPESHVPEFQLGFGIRDLAIGTLANATQTSRGLEVAMIWDSSSLAGKTAMLLQEGGATLLEAKKLYRVRSNHLGQPSLPC